MGVNTRVATIWRELRKLRDEIPPPLTDAAADSNKKEQDRDSGFYKDYAAFAACNEVRTTIGRSSELPREEFLDTFTRLVAGPRLEELFDLFKASRSPHHPALQYACLLALHGVAELGDRRKELLSRPDVVREFLAVMESPRPRAVTPRAAGEEGSEVANSAAGAITTITSLFTSNGPLEPAYAKLWVELGAVSALASCLESHAAFDRANPVSTELPLCFFLIATSLLAGAADAVSVEGKVRLGTAWLRVFVESTRWIAHEAADLLADFYTRPEWLKGIVPRMPEGLRARAVEAARACEREGADGGSSWKRGKADRLALALLAGNRPVWDDEGRLVGKNCAGPGCDRSQACGDGVDSGGAGDNANGVASATDAVGAEEGEGAIALFKRCSACHAVSYCSRQCQVAHWKKGHKRACAALRE